MNQKKIKISTFVILTCFSLAVVPFITVSAGTESIWNPPATQADPVLDLIIIWHQHQPSYQDPDSGVYEQPWVFMHGTNSYPYMADVLNDYQDINVTINLTPSLLQQLNDYVTRDAYDRRLEVAYMDEAAMSDENKSIALQYFFDINSQFRQNGTRYFELSEKRNSYGTLQEAIDGFSDQDYLDLKALFFAHWINPRYTTEMPYAPPSSPFGFTLDVLSKDAAGIGGYSIDHKEGVLDYGYSIVDEAFNYHSQIQDEGRLEIITTPFYHPILPLLIDLENAREVNEGVADLPLPVQNTLWTEDALVQIEKGRNYTEQIFGQTPVGMWPSEQAVCEEIIPLVNQSGLEWFVTDYTVLQNSLGVSSLTPEQWFKPYQVEKDGATSVVFFRHQQLSDELGFNYGGLDPEVAADNMIQLLSDIQTSWTGVGDPVFTVALDGENAWENYQYDLDGDEATDYTGNLFREYMYQKLEEAQTAGWLRTLTPKQYLAEHPPESLDPLTLATGSWAGDLNVWIGEKDENLAWDRLITTRTDLTDYQTAHPAENLTAAWEALYAAEGSDWWWWYGADKDSGHDELFDWAFKSNLRGVYKAIGWTDEDIMLAYPELFLQMLPPVAAVIDGKELPTIDGVAGGDEWLLSANYQNAYANSSTALIKDMYAGVDEELNALHLRIDTTDLYPLGSITNRSIDVYFSKPGANYSTIFPRFADPTNFDEILGFELVTDIAIDLESEIIEVFKVNTSYEWELTSDVVSYAIGNIVEITIPFGVLGVEKGEMIYLRAVTRDDSTGDPIEVAPEDGPWSIALPFGGVDMIEIFSMDDPAYDEHGIYPTNPQMHPDGDVEQTGLMDILRFRVGYQDDKVYFEFKFRELYNPWNGPGGYSHPLMQVYVDQDNIPGSGRTSCDQNAHIEIEDAHAWDVLVRADGWLQYILMPDDTQIGGMETYSDSVDKVIVFSAPLSVIGTPTEDWFYTVVVGSQDFQAFREFYVQPQEWKFGGGDDGGYDPNTVDVLLPAGSNQSAILSSWTEGQFAIIPAVGAVEEDVEPPTITVSAASLSVTLEKGETTINVTVNWTATDNVGIDHFVLYDGGVLLSTLADTISSYTLELIEGTHNITIYAYDAAGNSAMGNVLIVVEGPRGIPGFTGLSLSIALIAAVFVIGQRLRRKK